MKMMIPKHMCCALTLAPLAVSAASADMVSVGGVFQAVDSAMIEFHDLNGEHVMSHENPYTDSVSGSEDLGFVDSNSWGSGGEYNVFGGQNAYSRRDTVFNTDATGFEYSGELSARASLGDGHESRSAVSSTMDMYMSFDRDTLIDVFLRIDYERLMNTDLYASFSIAGAQDIERDQIEVAHPGIAGWVEYSFRALVLAGDTFSLTNEAMIEYSTLESGDTFGTGELSMTAIVSVVPAPSGAAMLGGLGLVAMRRRRAR